jgi:hypothetical protein
MGVIFVSLMLRKGNDGKYKAYNADMQEPEPDLVGVVLT